MKQILLSTDSINQSQPVQNSDGQQPPTELDPHVVRPLPPEFIKSELTLHGIFFLMAAAVLSMSFLMRSEGPKTVFLPGFQAPMPEACSSKRIFGIDCPGCGLTRSFISISHGNVARAWGLNRASIVVYLFVAIQIPWHALQIWRLCRKGRPFDMPGIYYIPVLVVVVLMLNWVGRMSSLW